MLSFKNNNGNFIIKYSVVLFAYTMLVFASSGCTNYTDVIVTRGIRVVPGVAAIATSPRNLPVLGDTNDLYVEIHGASSQMDYKSHSVNFKDGNKTNIKIFIIWQRDGSRVELEKGGFCYIQGRPFIYYALYDKDILSNGGGIKSVEFQSDGPLDIGVILWRSYYSEQWNGDAPPYPANLFGEEKKL